MRILSYRNKRRLKKAGLILLAALGIFLAFCFCRFLYLQRFMVFGNGEVKLDYEQDLEHVPQPPEPGWKDTPIEIVMEEPSKQNPADGEQPMKPLSGYYITTEMLQNMEQVNKALADLTNVKTVMLDLKSIYGSFYYPSGTTGASMATVTDVMEVESLIDRLAAQEDIYLIARIASLTDNNFALAHQSTGLPMRSGALWMDSHGCYWLDPMATSVQEYLVSIAQELEIMGFDEVVFDGFRIPDSDNIVYISEFTREDAAAEAAKSLKGMLELDPIRVSFNSSNSKVAENSDRIYLVTDDGSQVAELVESVSGSMENPAAQIVFLTNSRDTRFDGYGILRPLIEAREE